jgi:NAD(P)-dependent dehydrogenase (short-subunit alcohol dehydrogenase family)
VAAVLVVGASRGIGLEFVRQYAADRWQVLATHRQPADAGRLRALGARPLALDVRDAAAIYALPAALAAVLGHERIGVAILNAGVFGPRTTALEPPTQAEFDLVMHTNVLAPMRLIPALAPAVAAPGGRLAVLSSRMGSIGAMTSASGWLYRASKAAVNGVVRAASLELGPRGIVCMAFHPGWVRTEMGGAGADLDVAASVQGMRNVIAQANDSHNGKFLNYTGEHIPW